MLCSFRSYGVKRTQCGSIDRNVPLSDPNAAPDIDLAALTAGDRRAWRLFVDRHGPTIYGVARRQMARAGLGEEDAAEIVQNVFVRLCNEDFRLLRTYDPARAGLGTWLRVVAASSAIDYLRRAKRTVPLDTVPESVLAKPAPEPTKLRIPDAVSKTSRRMVSISGSRLIGGNVRATDDSAKP